MTDSPQQPIRIINSIAPIRVCDLGGWTDTWFAGTGAVLNIGVSPYAEVQIRVLDSAAPRITIHAENFGDRYEIVPGRIHYDRHPLLEACIDIMGLPDSLALEVDLFSAAPAGCSTGTSAAVSVALLGALDLLRNGRRAPHQIASLAHRVETEKLGLQCGIQDQLCAAYGGVCFIEMFNYPHASVSKLELSPRLLWELERRLVLVFLGEAHASSEVHGKVIARLEEPNADTSVLEPLRKAAHDGKDALFAGDMNRFGRAMIANTEAQAALHPALVSPEATAVIELAKSHGAIGWKVNGAGGDGGSLSILCSGTGAEKRAFIGDLRKLNAKLAVIPMQFSETGLRCWES